jgi:hypothetical protein
MLVPSFRGATAVHFITLRRTTRPAGGGGKILLTIRLAAGAGSVLRAVTSLREGAGRHSTHKCKRQHRHSNLGFHRHLLDLAREQRLVGDLVPTFLNEVCCQPASMVCARQLTYVN